MMQFSNVLAIGIPDGNVNKVAIGDNEVWQKRAKRVPDGYEELTYVRVTGAQYLQTDYTPVIGEEIILENLSVDVEDDLQCLLSAGASGRQCYVYWGTRIQCRCFQSWNDAAPLGYTVRNRTFRFYGKDRLGLLFDGQAIVHSTIYDGAMSDAPLRFFQHASGTNQCVNVSVGDIAIVNTSGTIMRYIPARRTSDSRVGFYEIMSNTFNLSAGTEDFVAGTPI